MGAELIVIVIIAFVVMLMVIRFMMKNPRRPDNDPLEDTEFDENGVPRNNADTGFR